MKLLPTCLFALLLTQATFAQQSIGFSDSTDFEYLINYRLPSWGYSQFSLNTFSGNYELENHTSENHYSSSRNMIQTFRNSTSNVSFNPDYRYWYESEKRVISLNTNYSFDYTGRKNVNEVENNSPVDFHETEGRYDHSSATFGHTLSLNTSINDYYSSENGAFLYGALDGSLIHSNDDEETTYTSGNTSDLENLRRILSINPSIAVGFGRIRNVTPVIRAIRLNERYKSLGNSSLTETNIIQTAEQFTKYQGYTRSYDRPQKFFWEDASSSTGIAFSSMKAFDLMYLNDIFDEVLGSRYEGYEFMAGLNYSYTSYLYRQTDINESNRVLIKNKRPGIFASYNLYKNLNLSHQLHFQVGSYHNFLDKIELDNWINSSSLRAGWLWNIADKLLLTVDSRNNLNFYKSSSNASNQLVFQSYLSANFTYFIENSLSISTQLGSTYRISSYDIESYYDSDIDVTTLSMMIGIQYYFNRNLF